MPIETKWHQHVKTEHGPVDIRLTELNGTYELEAWMKVGAIELARTCVKLNVNLVAESGATKLTEAKTLLAEWKKKLVECST